MYCDIPQCGRCCFCMPLRRGVLVFGYLNLFFTAFLIGFHSYSIEYDVVFIPILHTTSSIIPAEFSIALYCVEVILNGVMIYGAHKNIVSYLRGFYYFTITTTIGNVLIELLECFSFRYFGIVVEVCLLITAELLIKIYLILTLRSLIKKMEVEGDHQYDNPLNQIVTGEVKVEPNGIYNDTTTNVNPNIA